MYMQIIRRRGRLEYFGIFLLLCYQLWGFYSGMITIISTFNIGKINKLYRSCCLTLSIIDVEMAATLSFRWLDILEKEFDKAFVDLDLLLGEIDPDQCELTYDGRQKMTALSAAFAQLCHKSQTVFQSNAKIEVFDII